MAVNVQPAVNESVALPPPTVWEDAYLRFETPEEEVRKFRRRLLTLGADRWPRTSQVTELFCGRGNGLVALSQIGFQRIDGIDLSPALAGRYRGTSPLVVGDCRALPFSGGSRDVLIVQGGLHHLPTLPGDLVRTIEEVHRVLSPDGRFVIVEPWRTPFLTLVHRVSEVPIVRRVSAKMDAFATMTEEESETYFRWLDSADVILSAILARFEPEFQRVGWGKLMFVGRKRAT